ncbi:MAG: tRNA 2-selenouridine(34) synthase MnmH [Clostridia bacterium]|jgi:tRNA 2-selenouridine synthase|nr:tRNA 2-selenouridine(34) synthase MnmH [Clostridia bacterium]
MTSQFTHDYTGIVLHETPLIDVRAPVEFARGAFVNAVNLPLMNDEERHLVGICYKEKGSAEATRLGHQLVSGLIRAERTQTWIAHLEKYPDSIIHCFGGDLRSQIAQQWIQEAAGRLIPRLKGGYKAFRNYLLTELNTSLEAIPVLLGGNTGSGKTVILKKLPNAIDLEALANHRGSAFGAKLSPQPAQITFENSMAYKLIQHRAKGYRSLIIEDEGSRISRCIIPKAPAEYFNSGDIVLVELSLAERIENIFHEYVLEAQQDYLAYYGESGLAEWFLFMSAAMEKIKQRFGGHLPEMLTLLQSAYQKQRQSGDTSGHRRWIEMLLTEYYDPLYQRQLKKASRKILFRGNAAEVTDYFKQYCAD